MNTVCNFESCVVLCLSIFLGCLVTRLDVMDKMIIIDLLKAITKHLESKPFYETMGSFEFWKYVFLRKHSYSKKEARKLTKIF